ncbi:hypothetical protein PMKS-002379 [Pichia membranifaciens]|uniref:Uncharacterized protein n=1 Tax=Pichia membranifaciens TaxID=4926 RepID=A0A1Q2YHE3_9ASCO|nr:hypothetical protein PMKS-002379 [Pichia membranifaciens]
MVDKGRGFEEIARTEFKDSRFDAEPLVEYGNEPTHFLISGQDGRKFKEYTEEIRARSSMENPSNRVFTIYRDPSDTKAQRKNLHGLVHDQAHGSKVELQHSRLPKKSNKYGLRIISDTVLTKRNFSSDNEMIPKKRAELSEASDLPENMERARSLNRSTSKQYFAPETAFERVRAPLQRKPLALISPLAGHDESGNVYNYEGTKFPGDTGKQKSDDSDNELENSSDKENIYPGIELEKPLVDSDDSLESQKYGDSSSKYGAIHLFTPQHYWNLTFTRKQTGAAVSLEDFHLLLYDYERLWDRYIDDFAKDRVT